jgi:hypothetical protein
MNIEEAIERLDRCSKTRSDAMVRVANAMTQREAFEARNDLLIAETAERIALRDLRALRCGEGIGDVMEDGSESELERMRRLG